MEQPTVPINYLAVLVAALVPMIIGFAWYSPALFAKKWMAILGKTEEEIKKSWPGSNPQLSFAPCFIQSRRCSRSALARGTAAEVSGGMRKCA
jgi:hypothetical protein